MEKIKNLSIRKTIILYMMIVLVASFFLSGMIIQITDKTQRKIWDKYTDREAHRAADIVGDELRVCMEIHSRHLHAPLRGIFGPNSVGATLIGIKSPTKCDAQRSESNFQTRSRVEEVRVGGALTRIDAFTVELCDFLETWSILIISVCGCVIAVFLFYRNKIKRPLEELQTGSRMIAGNELEFSITYTNRDEMGTLCGEFERMRRQLSENNRSMWKMIEQEKALRSAIAHDIRSPLAILKGYQEMMLEFVPTEVLDKEKVVDMLRSGMDQIEYLNAFIDTMRQLSRLEDRKIQYQEIGLEGFIGQVKKNAVILGEGSKKVCKVEAYTGMSRACFDVFVVSEVLENLVSNALRYAVKEVRIELLISDSELIISVMDDGAGFREEAGVVTEAYYHANPQDDLNHFGLGLYISRIYCEKHGGSLLVGNQQGGGARVKAIFPLKEEG